MSSWSAWKLDPVTWQWIIILSWALILEGFAVGTGQYRHTLTAHLRPVFAQYPVTWWLTFGFWLWLGLHFLAWRWEYRLLNWFVGGP